MLGRRVVILLLLAGALVAGAFVVENEPSDLRTETSDVHAESS